MSYKSFVVLALLFSGILLGPSGGLAQDHEGIAPALVSKGNPATDAKVEALTNGLRSALKEIAGDQHVAKLVMVDGEIIVLVRDVDGAVVAAYATALGGHVIHMDTLSVTGENGEVISANPHVSSSSEK